MRFRARWLVTDAMGATRERSRTFPTREDAEDHLRKVERSKRLGQYRDPSIMTVSELVAEFIDRAQEAGRIADRTALTYRHRAPFRSPAASVSQLVEAPGRVS